MSKTTKEIKETPLMKQYNKIKGKYPDALLLFRVGDFYETFGEDAIKAARILGITLTKRKNGAASHIELAGFPHHSIDTYLPKLVRSGQRVAICDQLEDPKTTKSIVKRGVTELVTPGLSYNDHLLNNKENNFLAAIYLNKQQGGVAFLDISTGEFLIAEGSIEYIDKLIQSFAPREILYNRQKKQQFLDYFGESHHVYFLEDWAFQPDFARDNLTEHFNTASLKGFGVADMEYAITAAGAIMHYLNDTEHTRKKHITKISRIEKERYVWLDRFTLRNLELFHSTSPGGVGLIDVLDQTITPMGGRLLKRWLALPLKEVNLINERHQVVECFLKNSEFKESVGLHLNDIGDIERLSSKAAFGRINPREVIQLKRSLELIIPIKESFEKANCEPLNRLGDQLNPCPKLIERIRKEIDENPPVQLHKGKVINDGVSEELDELRSIRSNGKDYLIKIQDREIENTGISSLKIGFNNVFGYYLEVRHTHKDKIPDDWIRKQTLTGAERYITQELKEYESKILGAEEKIAKIESSIYEALVTSISEYIKSIQLNGEIIAQADCLHNFAKIALKHHYTRPHINDSYSLAINGGRHPVIEKQLKTGEEYVANDLFVDADTQQVLMITGPNMAGKSAYLRQNALIVIMAQMGSFVPAKNAEIGLVDKIFTRVGASDNISQGESTFMVEMNETASILNNISERSLVILDEIGRGTSTYDGISIAWAIAEYLHEHKTKPKTLFATHYHELNEMTHVFDRVKNYNVSIREIDKKIVFLRKLIPGGSEHSFGIHVAKMAGMPSKVITRANKMLDKLEEKESEGRTVKNSLKAQKEDMQLSFFQLDDPTLAQIRDEIINIDINTLTPVEALMKLNEIKSILQG
ncbi:MAG: DNA mismatch repair protein MutS [Flavobacteriales bacterium]|nr:DNA mismatch repair protein MutS [Flavobacteriales bacterium]